MCNRVEGLLRYGTINNVILMNNPEKQNITKKQKNKSTDNENGKMHRLCSSFIIHIPRTLSLKAMRDMTKQLVSTEQTR